MGKKDHNPNYSLQQNPEQKSRSCSLQICVKTSTESIATRTEPFYKTLSALGSVPTLRLMGLLILPEKFYFGVALPKPVVRAEYQIVSMDFEPARMPGGKIPGPQVSSGQVR